MQDELIDYATHGCFELFKDILEDPEYLHHIDAGDSYGETLLYKVCESTSNHQSMQFVEYLLMRGASPLQGNLKGHTPLHCAFRHQKGSVALKLLDACPSYWPLDVYKLFKKIPSGGRGITKKIKALFERGLSPKDTFLRALKLSPCVIELYVDAGVDLSSFLCVGFTIKYYAVRDMFYYPSECIEELLRFGANPDSLPYTFYENIVHTPSYTCINDWNTIPKPLRVTVINYMRPLMGNMVVNPPSDSMRLLLKQKSFFDIAHGHLLSQN